MARKSNNGKVQAEAEITETVEVEATEPQILTVADILGGADQAEFAGWTRLPVKHAQMVALEAPDGSEMVTWVAKCRCGCGEPVHVLKHREGYWYTYYTTSRCYAEVVKNKNRTIGQQARFEAYQASSPKIWALDREVVRVRKPLKPVKVEAAAPAEAEAETTAE